MKILVVGAGIGGLAAAIKLLENGHQVVVIEMSDKPGGLANGYKEKKWKWSIEKFYHHIFTGDKYIIELSKKVGCPVRFEKPLTSVRFDGEMSQLDDPISLLGSPLLSLPSKLWMATGLVILKLIPDGLAARLEKYRAIKALPYILGPEGFEKIWKRLLTAKFGPYVEEVNMAWFWARIAKRSQALGYFEGGFETLADKAAEYIRHKGGEIRFGTKIEKIVVGKEVMVGKEKFDRVILTIPAPYIEKIFDGKIKFPKLNYLWGQTLVLRLKKSLMKPYWLNILEKNWPFLVCVEHTNFMDKKYYGGERIVYLGNYLADGDKRLEMNDKQLFDFFWGKLRLINNRLKRTDVVGYTKFQAPFAQPVFPTNYSKSLPEISQFRGKILIANMSMVYPFDRGTNYAVALGEKAASLID
jgi:protoporphyrinogen oxidase